MADVTRPTAPRLFLVDGYALIYRAFFAMIADRFPRLPHARDAATSAPAANTSRETRSTSSAVIR